MDILIYVAVGLVVWNRWFLFERFLGKTGMYLVDTLLCTVLAAWLFAAPGTWPIFSYIVATGCAVIAWASGRAFLRRLETKNDDNK